MKNKKKRKGEERRETFEGMVGYSRGMALHLLLILVVLRIQHNHRLSEFEVGFQEIQLAVPIENVREGVVLRLACV